MKTSVEVAGIWLVGVETNKGTAAEFYVSASQAESSCSQINSGDVGRAVSEHPWEELNGDRMTTWKHIGRAQHRRRI